MKKIVMLAALLLIGLQSTAFAAALDTGGTNTTGNGESIYGCGAGQSGATCTTMLGRMSKGVGIGVKYDTAAYALATKHSGGSNVYATAGNATAIYMQKDGTLAAPSASDSSAFASGWSAM